VVKKSLGIVLIEYSGKKREENLTAGPITMQTDPFLVRLYEQMPEPKYVIAMEACILHGACSMHLHQ
jgi:NADH:ubiquinone oxidoreductase subunit B-like Fe-S oxidoreductase